MVHMHIGMNIGVATLIIGFEGVCGQASYEMGMILQLVGRSVSDPVYLQWLYCYHYILRQCAHEAVLKGLQKQNHVTILIIEKIRMK